MPKKSESTTETETETETEQPKADHDHGPHDHKHDHGPHDHEDVKSSIEELRGHKHDPAEPPAPDKSTKAEIDKPPQEVTAEKKERRGPGMFW